MYLKSFEVRWNDLDANRHLANSAYINFMSHTRMTYLSQAGLSVSRMEEHRLGPIVFYEHIYYFREVLPGRPVRVSLELKGLSEDGMFFEFHHNFYDEQGRNLAHCEMMGSWIDMESRKLIPLPASLLDRMQAMERAADFRVLTREDTRKYARKPKDLA